MKNYICWWQVVKAGLYNAKQQEINKLVAVSYKFLQKIHLKLDMQSEKGMYFSFSFGWYSIQLDILSVRHQEQVCVCVCVCACARACVCVCVCVWGVISRQNLLSVTKVICQWSLCLQTHDGKRCSTVEFYKLMRQKLRDWFWKEKI